MANKSYVLTWVYDREIQNMFFDTYQEAYDTMQKQLNETIDCEFLDGYVPKYREDYAYTKYSAYVNGLYGTCDWAIDEIR